MNYLVMSCIAPVGTPAFVARPFRFVSDLEQLPDLRWVGIRSPFSNMSTR